ncbi:hypothetical protein GWI72_16805 [Microvirga tunisiensis]|uniref:CheW-like domain-containing protein n=1 Tax=Pannonibacter tanglangensis TaxID=2750084 RepID=A0A7X5F5M0_9HYPH|nr:hypothetical protein [Pannonibacter sp. XCT-53]
MEHIDYLLATLGSTRLALPLDLVLSVNEPAPVTPLPFCPRHVRGLVFVQDRVLPLMDLAGVLGLPPSPAGTAAGSLVILANGDDVRALEVDHVVAMVAVETDAIHPLAEAEADAGGIVPSPFLPRRLSARGADWLVLDWVRLAAETRMDAEGLVEDGALIPADPVGLPETIGEDEIAAASERFAHLLIDLGPDRYALPTAIIADVLEPSGLRAMPGAPAYVAGLMEHADTPLLVIDTGGLLGARPSAFTGPEPDSVILRISDPSARRSFALLADRAPGLLSLTAEEIFTADDAVAGISRYAVVDERIIAILDPLALVAGHLAEIERLTPHRTPGETGAAAAAASGQPPRDASAAALRPGFRFLTLRVADDFFAIDLDRVDSILSTVRLTPLPGDGNGFDGMADAGDRVVPVLDLRRRLGVLTGALPGALTGALTGARPERQPDDAPPCVLLQLEGSTAGLAVDQVLRIEDVAAEDIDEVADRHGLPVHAVARVRDRLMAVLTLDRLLPRLVH